MWQSAAHMRGRGVTSHGVSAEGFCYKRYSDTWKQTKLLRQYPPYDWTEWLEWQLTRETDELREKPAPVLLCPTWAGPGGDAGLRRLAAVLLGPTSSRILKQSLKNWRSISLSQSILSKERIRQMFTCSLQTYRRFRLNTQVYRVYTNDKKPFHTLPNSAVLNLSSSEPWGSVTHTLGIGDCLREGINHFLVAPAPQHMTYEYMF
jgi:hypothetical protein